MISDTTHDKKENEGINWIHGFPDPILALILSFLSTKEAVQTCLLSKRWKKLWASVLALRFDFRDISQDPLLLYGEEEYNKFERFIKCVLQNREACPIDVFHINWIPYESHATVDFFLDCISAVLVCKPRVFNVSCPSLGDKAFSTDSIFTCMTLQEVYWCHSPRGMPPNSVNLPCLQKLHLQRIKFDDDLSSKLSLGCPVLEVLFLSDCYLSASWISFPLLRELFICRCYNMGKLKISTPKLLHLKITDSFDMDGIYLENMVSLINASLSSLDYDIFTISEPKLLHQLSNATSLDLAMKDLQFICISEIIGADMKEVLKREVHQCITFNNLKRLTLRTQFMLKLDLVAFFLNNSPNLKKLTLHHRRRSFSGFYYYTPPEVAPEEERRQEEQKDGFFQRDYLEMVEIIRYSTNESVNFLVKYLNTHVKSIGEIRIL